MSKLKSLLAHTWALLAIPILMATFMGIPFFSRLLADSSGVKVSPWYVGGDVTREIDHGAYRTVLRRPVFDALIGQRAIGFVQIEWLPAQGAVLPAHIQEAIDYDGDGTADFDVELDVAANHAAIVPHSSRVLGLARIYNLKDERVIRVGLRRQ